MVNYIDMYTKSHKGIKTKMETIVGLYGKGNHLLALVMCRIVPCLEWQLLLHALLLLKHIAPNLDKSYQQ
jgi:hypothetical protein